MTYSDTFAQAKIEYNTTKSEEVRKSLERLFPQLKSYRDEEIEEYLITFIENNYGVGHKVDQQSVISWIKRHGKQKSTEWCGGDEVAIERIIDTILAIKDIKMGKQKTFYHNEILDRLIDWLKNLKSRFNKV